MQLYDWQEPSTATLQAALTKYGVAADGSDTGTGKMYKACAIAKRMGVDLAVVCPKAIIEEWRKVAADWGVFIVVLNYEQVRTGKTVLGRWQVKNRVFEWTIPGVKLLVFDEAHKLGGRDTQQSKMLVAATRQKLPRLLCSASLIANPLKGYAIGHTLGLHRLTDYMNWLAQHEVTHGLFGLEWKVSRTRGDEIMAQLRVEMGDKFDRIKKADVPGFPQNQVIPAFVTTKEMPELDSGEYGMEARRTVELLKVGALTEQAKDLVEQGMSVAIFVNFLATLDALIEQFPHAGIIRGGQSTGERQTVINSFQHNENFVLLIMAQAGGTGLSLHDLHGRPRAALISPGWSAVEFLQVLGRIHRAGSLSPAVNYIVLASGVPVERRIRTQLDKKLSNLSALNDYDLAAPHAKPNDAPGTQESGGGTPPDPVDNDPDECGVPGDEGIESKLPGIDQVHPCGSDAHGPGGGVCSPPGETSGPGGTGMNTIAALPGVESATTCSAEDAAEAAKAVLNAISSKPKKAHNTRKHARVSPSKGKNLEICPSYEGDNDATPHPVTLRGTVMHEALESGKNDALQNTPETGDEFALVQMCRDFLAEEIATATKVVIEPHVKTHDKDVQGFADIVLYYEDEGSVALIKVRDFKMGWNLVDLPDVNFQSIAYACGLFIANPECETIDFAFLIPRKDAVLQHTFTRADLPAMKLRISTVAERVRKLAGKEFNPTDDNCLYCGRKATCVALHQKALVIANGYNDDEKLVLPTEFHSSLITDPVQMAKALNVANIVEKWVESVKSHAIKLRLEVGIEIPGYTLVERQGKREVIAPTVAATIAQQFGVTQEDYIQACKVSLTALDKLVSAKTTEGKAKAVEAFNDALTDSGAVTRTGSYYTLQKERKKKAGAIDVAATTLE